MECNGKTTHGEIFGHGIILLQPACKFYTPMVTLIAEDSKSKNISHPIVTVDVENNCIEGTPDLYNPGLVPIQINDVSLDTLNTIKDEIKHHSKILNQDKYIIQEHPYNFTLMSLSLGSVLLIYTLYKFCNCCNLFKYFYPRINSHEQGCIQIFNNCFDQSRRRQQIEIPMSTYNTTTTTTACISSDDEEEDAQQTSSKVHANRRNLYFKGEVLCGPHYTIKLSTVIYLIIISLPCISLTICLCSDKL
ncbi:unnamed protein product [Pieris macdunnoughi]|uniref:Uncharacterized protein n=1 Tax=Pieris macdunnoughi TaxID=345717 RepID=A0A821TT04_9NEOP|nr:unnamed protein product [Pieris macdunnoughi]